MTGDFTVIQDADLEYDPEDFKKLINRLGEATKRYTFNLRIKKPAS